MATAPGSIAAPGATRSQDRESTETIVDDLFSLLDVTSSGTLTIDQLYFLTLTLCHLRGQAVPTSWAELYRATYGLLQDLRSVQVVAGAGIAQASEPTGSASRVEVSVEHVLALFMQQHWSARSAYDRATQLLASWAKIVHARDGQSIWQQSIDYVPANAADGDGRGLTLQLLNSFLLFDPDSLSIRTEHLATLLADSKSATPSDLQCLTSLAQALRTSFARKSKPQSASATPTARDGSSIPNDSTDPSDPIFVRLSTILQRYSWMLREACDCARAAGAAPTSNTDPSSGQIENHRSNVNGQSPVSKPPNGISNIKQDDEFDEADLADLAAHVVNAQWSTVMPGLLKHNAFSQTNAAARSVAHRYLEFTAL